MGYILVYNPKDYAIPVDRDGHSVYPHSWAAADEEYTASAIKLGHLNIVDVDTIGANSSQAAIIAKELVANKNREHTDVTEAPGDSYETPKPVKRMPRKK